MKELVGMMVLLLTACIHSINNAQQVSIHIDNGNIQKVFKQIQTQSGIGYSLDTDLLNQAKKMTLHLDKASLRDVLAVISKGQPFIVVCKNRLITLQPREP